MLFRDLLLFAFIIVALAQTDDTKEDDEEPQCIVTQWTTWSPCRAPRTYQHIYVDGDEDLNEDPKDVGKNGPSPPAPPPMDVKRRKRDMSHHIEKRHAINGPSRRAKRQAEAAAGIEIVTAHQVMGIIGKKKLETWAHRQACREKETCPELNKRKSSGAEKCINGTAAGIFPCQNIDLLSLISIDGLGYDEPILGDNSIMANDIWGWTDPMNEDEYVLIGLSGGTSFVRITDPLKPEVLGILYSRTTFSPWRDIKVVNNTAYIVSEAPDHGMQVFDLTQLRNQTGFHILTESATYSEFGSSHNIVSNEETGYVYAVGNKMTNYEKLHNKRIKDEEKLCKGGLHIIDVIEPLNPKFVACFDEDGYTHDAQCVVYRGPHTKYAGKEVCFAYNEDTLTIVDLTDHMRPKMISRTEYRGAQYTHQGWLTEDQTVLVLDDEQDEMKNVYDAHTKTYLWDVTNLEKPIFKSTYESPVIAIDHNQYVMGNYTWQSNYRSGLQVLYIDQVNFDLKPVAYFDVLPIGDGAIFEGTWSNYPFFKSGVIAVSSIEFGLVLLQPDYEAMAELSNQNGGLRDPNIGAQWRTRDITEAGAGAECLTTEERRACDVNEIESGIFLD